MWKRFPAHTLLEQQFYTRKELPAGQASEPDFSCPKTTQHSIIAGTLRYIAVDAACDRKNSGKDDHASQHSRYRI